MVKDKVIKDKRTDTQSKYWCFTLNNPSDDHIKQIEKVFNDRGEYLVWQFEIGTNGTEHMQGYICLKKRIRFSSLKNLLPNETHFETRRSTHENAKKYCMKKKTRKEGTEPMEYGDDSAVPKTPGQRNDLEEVKMALMTNDNIDEIEERNFEHFCRYGKYFKDFHRRKKEKRELEISSEVYKKKELYPWQEEVLDLLDKQDDRKVLWVWGKNGNVGKSYLARYIDVTRKTFYCSVSKKSDLAYAYQCEPYFVFDVSRKALEFINYDSVESFKNGRIFSGKYESYTKRFNPPKIVIFANEEPDMTAWSSDRYQIYNVEDKNQPKKNQNSMVETIVVDKVIDDDVMNE